MRPIVVLIDSLLPVVRGLFAVIWAEMVSRTAGPLPPRFLLEPLMASAFAICYAIRDARSNRMPFLTGIVKRLHIAMDVPRRMPWKNRCFEDR